MEKIHKSFRLKRKLVSQIEEISERENLPFAHVAERLIEQGLTERKEVLGVSLIDSAIDRILSRHFRTLGDRICRLISRTLLESTTSRILIAQSLGQQLGKEKAIAFNNQAYKNAIEKSKEKIVELDEIMNTIAGSQSEATKKQAPTQANQPAR